MRLYFPPLLLKIEKSNFFSEITICNQKLALDLDAASFYISSYGSKEFPSAFILEDALMLRHAVSLEYLIFLDGMLQKCVLWKKLMILIEDFFLDELLGFC